MSESIDPEFPCSITISIPFPTSKLAHTAQRVLQVDQELSPLVSRSFHLASPSEASASQTTPSDATKSATTTATATTTTASEEGDDKNVLVTHYKATTNRMLRVSVNGFFESVAVVLQVMEELDVDVLAAKGR